MTSTAIRAAAARTARRCTARSSWSPRRECRTHCRPAAGVPADPRLGAPRRPPARGPPTLEARRRLLGAGSIYVGAVLVTYFIIGLGLLSFLGWLGRDHLVGRGASVLALLMALWVLEAVFLPGVGPSMIAPSGTHGRMQKAMERGGLSGMLLAGALRGICTAPRPGALYPP